MEDANDSDAKPALAAAANKIGTAPAAFRKDGDNFWSTFVTKKDLKGLVDTETCKVPNEHLQKSSKRARKLGHGKGLTITPNEEATLIPVLEEERSRMRIPVDAFLEMRSEDKRVDKTTVLRYLACISPTQLNDLPVYDIDIGPAIRLEDGSYWLGPIVKKIHWTLEESMEMYLFAAWMDDKHVCDLVVKKWYELWREDELSLWDKTRVNAVFRVWEHQTEDNLGPKFWVDVLTAARHDSPSNCKMGVGWHEELVRCVNGSLAMDPRLANADVAAKYDEIFNMTEMGDKTEYKLLKCREKKTSEEYAHIALRLLFGTRIEYPGLVRRWLTRY